MKADLSTSTEHMRQIMHKKCEVTFSDMLAYLEIVPISLYFIFFLLNFHHPLLYN